MISSRLKSSRKVKVMAVHSFLAFNLKILNKNTKIMLEIYSFSFTNVIFLMINLKIHYL
jgi:hypothetical protein